VAADYYTADPVNLLNGNLVYQIEDTRVESGLLSLRFQRSYNSLNLVYGPLGFGWTHPYNTWLSIEPGPEPDVYLYAHDGAVFHFTRNPDGTYSPPAGIHRVLAEYAPGRWSVGYRNGVVQYFEQVTSTIYGGPIGRLEQIQDAQTGVATSLSYDGFGDLVSITDSAGRSIHLAYDPTWHHIDSLIDPQGRIYAYQYRCMGLSSATFSVVPGLL
jgi:YD repeat-containing protein